MQNAKKSTITIDAIRINEQADNSYLKEFQSSG